MTTAGIRRSRIAMIVALTVPFAVFGTRSVVHPARAPVALLDSDDYAWVDPTPDPASPANCGNCHQAIHDEWARSAHARASTGRHFLEARDQLHKDYPEGVDVCSSCHAPTVPVSFADTSSPVAPGLSGVHCDFCHKVVGPGEGEFGLTHGKYQLTFLRPDPSARRQLIVGPLRDPARRENQFSPFQTDSRLCASCHEGVVFGIPVYTTYSEWLASPAGKDGVTCQACHMTPTGGMTNIAPGHGGVERDPATLGNHRFFAKSQLDMLTHSLELSAEVAIGRAEIRLTARNVGHAVPTGSIDRHLIVTVEAFIGPRPVTIYHGPRLSSEIAPRESGMVGKVYAKVLADRQGRRPARFWKADPASLQDTRLKPNETDRFEIAFPDDVDHLRVRVIHRPRWNAAVDEQQTIYERDFPLKPAAKNR
jgi:hypothetical protein